MELEPCLLISRNILELPNTKPLSVANARHCLFANEPRIVLIFLLANISDPSSRAGQNCSASYQINYFRNRPLKVYFHERSLIQHCRPHRVDTGWKSCIGRMFVGWSHYRLAKLARSPCKMQGRPLSCRPFGRSTPWLDSIETATSRSKYEKVRATHRCCSL